jgi:hypothetical protein
MKLLFRFGQPAPAPAQHSFLRQQYAHNQAGREDNSGRNPFHSGHDKNSCCAARQAASLLWSIVAHRCANV